MIVVKLEMWPGGDESKAVEFGRAYITNQLVTSVQSGGQQGDYQVKLYGGVYGRRDLLKRLWKKASVDGFDRVRMGAWDLLYLALKAALRGRL